MATTISLTSGNLFQIASSQYGEADQWIRIMEANGLTDPFISSASPITITIPAKSNPDTGGIPTAGISTPMVL